MPPAQRGAQVSSRGNRPRGSPAPTNATAGTNRHCWRSITRSATGARSSCRPATRTTMSRMRPGAIPTESAASAVTEPRVRLCSITPDTSATVWPGAHHRRRDADVVRAGAGSTRRSPWRASHQHIPRPAGLRPGPNRCAGLAAPGHARTAGRRSRRRRLLRRFAASVAASVRPPPAPHAQSRAGCRIPGCLLRRGRHVRRDVRPDVIRAECLGCSSGADRPCIRAFCGRGDHRDGAAAEHPLANCNWTSAGCRVAARSRRLGEVGPTQSFFGLHRWCAANHVVAGFRGHGRDDHRW